MKITNMDRSLLQKITERKAVICVLGLGRVGLPLATIFANKGLRVIGIDSDESRLDYIKNSKSPFHDDPDLEEYLQKANKSGNIQFQSNFTNLKFQPDVIVITVGTPKTSENNMDFSQLYSALDKICSIDVTNKFILLRSTVPPNTTNDIVIPYLESKSGIKCGEGFKIAVSPERIFVNKAIQEINELPEIIGGIDEFSNELGKELFHLINSKKDILFTTITGAELSKLFTNIYRYISFALSNEFAIWAEIYGVDANEIIRIANYNYPRSNIAVPGFVGGPCLSKDGMFLDNNTIFSSIVSTAFKLNESIPQHIVNNLKKVGGSLFGKKIAVLGITYKADSDDLRDSPSVKLVKILESQRAKVLVHDPYVKETLPLADVLKSPEIVILATNHSKFKDIASDITKSGCKMVYDVWSMYDDKDFNGVHYLRFGRSP